MPTSALRPGAPRTLRAVLFEATNALPRLDRLLARSLPCLLAALALLAPSAPAQSIAQNENYIRATLTAMGRPTTSADLAKAPQLLAGTLTREQFIRSILASADYRNPKTKATYNRYYQRDPVTAELAAAVALNHRELVFSLLMRSEYSVLHPPPTSFVVNLYNDVLQRPPESQAVVNSYVAQYTNFGKESVVSAFLGSAEYLAKFGGVLATGFPSVPLGIDFQAGLRDGTYIEEDLPRIIGSSQTYYNMVKGALPAPTLDTLGVGKRINRLSSVSFSLPDEGVPGSVTLAFGSNILTLANQHATRGSHTITFDPQAPTSSADVVSGAPIADGTYTATLTYQPQSETNPMSVTATAVSIDTQGPTGGTVAIGPALDVRPLAPMTLTFSGWSDAAGPLTYSLLVDASGYTETAPTSSTALNFEAPFFRNAYQVLARVRDGIGNVTEVPVAFQVRSPQELWRLQYFGQPYEVGTTGDEEDYDGDGIANLMEWATRTNPTLGNEIPGTLNRTADTLDFTYPQLLDAVDNGCAFIVEWTDSLESGVWTTTDVIQNVLSADATAQQVKASIPAPAGSTRFLRLRVFRTD